MAIQPLTPLPTPPLPTDGEDAFDQHAGESLTAQVTFTNEMNANVIPGINAAVQQVHDDAIYAGQAAARAEAVDTNVGEQVDAAHAYAVAAQASATAAESAQGSLGNLALIYAIALAS